MNVALGIVTFTTAIFALTLLIYTLFINPPFKNNSNRIEEPTEVGITPSRLASNNLIRVPTNKEAIIDLKGFGLENNDYVPPEPVRSSREIEAELHLNLEQAIIDAETNSTLVFEESGTTLSESATTNATSTTEIMPTEAIEETETIEPRFEKVLAFPECKKTRDGRRFC